MDTIGEANRETVEAIVLAHIEHGGDAFEGAMLDIPQRFFAIHAGAIKEIEGLIHEIIFKEKRHGR